MTKLALNKSSLNREKKKLDVYQRFLPSLELKQKQLMSLRQSERELMVRLRETFDTERRRLSQRFPMLASSQFDLRGMVVVEEVSLGYENAVGVQLPVLNEVRCRIQPYSLLAEPHWVDVALRALERTVRLRVQVAVTERRFALLEEAVRRTTQRVNLFKEVLIPEARENLRRIGIFLGDAQRNAVIRAKMAKSKYEKRVGA
ncbi:MAG: V-type ATP synthase subunit D [Myxococcota bacterium]